MTVLNTKDMILCIKDDVLNIADDVLCIKDDVLCIKDDVINTTDDVLCIKCGFRRCRTPVLIPVGQHSNPVGQ